MISAETDVAKQLLTIRFSGNVTPEEAVLAISRVETLLADLRPGFHVFTDVSELEEMDPECTQPISEIMDLCESSKVGSVYRLLPDPTKDIGFNILSRFHYAHSVRIVTFETRQEAEIALADLP